MVTPTTAAELTLTSQCRKSPAGNQVAVASQPRTPNSPAMIDERTVGRTAPAVTRTMITATDCFGSEVIGTNEIAPANATIALPSSKGSSADGRVCGSRHATTAKRAPTTMKTSANGRWGSVGAMRTYARAKRA